jgi:adenine phosphoribosyltransferase
LTGTEDKLDVTARLNLKAFIRDVPDFPQAGVLFRDITPLLLNAAAFNAAIDEMCSRLQGSAIDAIVAIESRGFLIGAPIAARLGLPLVPIRKPGKLPSVRMSIEYSLEYGESQLDIHADALTPGERVAIVDDVLATGGTARGAARLVELLGATVARLVFLIELKGLHGREQLQGYEVESLISYD